MPPCEEFTAKDNSGECHTSSSNASNARSENSLCGTVLLSAAPAPQNVAVGRDLYQVSSLDHLCSIIIIKSVCMSNNSLDTPMVIAATCFTSELMSSEGGREGRT